jgi:hypothetical protein
MCSCDGTGSRASITALVREGFVALLSGEHFLERCLSHMVNHRVQDFQDPLTSTLVLMATTPMQMVMCEAGVLPFKTNLLPVVPYSLLTASERAGLEHMLSHVADEALHATIESSGQYTLLVQPFTQNIGSSPTATFLCKRRLLCAFVRVMLSVHESRQVGCTLCNIVLQRFMAQVPTPSDIASLAVEQREHDGAAPPRGIGSPLPAPRAAEPPAAVEPSVVDAPPSPPPAKKKEKMAPPLKKAKAYHILPSNYK